MGGVKQLVVTEIASLDATGSGPDGSTASVPDAGISQTAAPPARPPVPGVPLLAPVAAGTPAVVSPLVAAAWISMPRTVQVCPVGAVRPMDCGPALSAACDAQ